MTILFRPFGWFWLSCSDHLADFGHPVQNIWLILAILFRTFGWFWLSCSDHLADFGYPVQNIWFYCFQNFKLFGFPIFRFWAYLMKVIPKNASCELNLISTFLSDVLIWFNMLIKYEWRFSLINYRNRIIDTIVYFYIWYKCSYFVKKCFFFYQFPWHWTLSENRRMLLMLCVFIGNSSYR